MPEWMPGAGFRRKARIWSVPTVEMSVAPFTAVKKALVSSLGFFPHVKTVLLGRRLTHFPKAAGTTEPSLMVSVLEDLSRRPDAPADEEDIIRNVGALAYAAGSDTVCSKFTHRSLLNPDHCHRPSRP
jgi:hypothetical protein